jgi:hypothetical protein
MQTQTTTNGAAKAPPPSAPSGHEKNFDVKLADPTYMVAALAKIGVKASKENAATKLADSLWQRFRVLPDNVRCSRCSGEFPEAMGDASFTDCPYCGADEDGNAPPVATATPAAVTPAATKETEPPKEAAMKDPKPKKTKDKFVPAPAADAKLAIAPKAPLAQASTDLDDVVAKIRVAQKDMVKSAYSLGLLLREVSEKDLWKLRSVAGDDGKSAPKFRSFDQWCDDEVGIGRQQAWRYVDVVKSYDAKAIAEFGVAKLSIVVRAHESVRDELEEKMRAGASKSDLAAEKKRLHDEKQLPDREPTRRSPGSDGTAPGRKAVMPSKEAAAKGGKANAKAADPKKITVAFIETTKAVKLFVKGTADKPAKRIGDGVFGVLEMTNDVDMVIKVAFNPDGHLVAKVVCRRKKEG